MQLSPRIAVGAGPHGQAVVCTSALGVNERLFRLHGLRATRPEKYTIQIGEGEHLAPEGETLWAFINHECDPSCAIDFASWELVTRRPIAVGEEITFNYLSTEWELASPFACRCGAPHCPEQIQGFRYLSLPQRGTLRPLLSPFLASRFHAGEDALAGSS